MVLYQEHDFRGVQLPPRNFPNALYFREMPQAEREEEVSRHRKAFELLREVRKARDFRLVLCADVWGAVAEYSVRMLKRAVAAESNNQGFDVLFPEPMVTCNPRRRRS